MIINVSGRTDIPAFYSKWFMNRYREGYVDVRNPFYQKLVSRIYFKDVDLILFCSKNPLPMIPYLQEIKKPVLFHATLTPYKKDIEPFVPDKRKIIDGIKELSKILGPDKVVVRYDPVFLNDEYDLSYHKKAFERVCSLLEGYIKTIVISFIDYYKNVEKNFLTLRLKDFTEEDYREIGLSFSSSAKKHRLQVQTCFEKRDLTEYGFHKGECLSEELAYSLTGKHYPEWKARKERLCHCVNMADIGEYNTCPHLCAYCYANYDAKEVKERARLHDDNSSLLLGHLEKDDIIKVRKP